MLILTRRVSEKLIIGDNVSITVLGVKGQQVRLGIIAPKEISVHREEIHQRIQQEKEQAREKQNLLKKIMPEGLQIRNNCVRKIV